MVYCVTGIYIQYLVVTYNGKESEKSIYIIYVCVCVLVVQSCLTLFNPMDCSPPGASVHGILQARKLEWVAISFYRDLLDPRLEPLSPALQADSLPPEPPGKS